MFVKITSVATLSNYILLVGFSTGEYKEFDLKPLIEKYEPFKVFKEINGLFEQVKIDIGGFGLIWNDDLDIAADGIYEKGIPCLPPDDITNRIKSLIDEFVKERKNAHLSQKQLEILSSIPQPSIARTEKGNVDPRLSTFLKMLEPLGLTLKITKI